MTASTLSKKNEALGIKREYEDDSTEKSDDEAAAPKKRGLTLR